MKQFKIWNTIHIAKKPDLSGINISNYAQDVLDKIDFNVSGDIDLVKIKVKDLGIKEGYSTISQIYAKAKKLGLLLCPPQVGPVLRALYKNQPLDEWLYIGMELITDSRGNPGVFSLGRLGSGLWLNDGWADPDGRWLPEIAFVFSLRNDLKPLETDTLTQDKVEITNTSLSFLTLRVERLEKIVEKLKEALND